VIHAIILAALTAASPAPKVGNAALQGPAYQPIPCSVLGEQVHNPKDAADGFGQLMAAALRIHGLDNTYPSIDRMAVMKAYTDFNGCFTMQSAAAPQSRPQSPQRGRK
jgi:hypothetical protein